MKYLLLALTLFASVAQAGEMIVTNISGDEVHLADKPCIHVETLTRIKPQARAQFRSAWAKVGGKYFDACWAVDRDKQEVFLVYQDGDQQSFSTGAFKYDPGA